ncbi:hypothetical protein [Sphingomonas sp.]|uniref:hypothetical protein n=1 Tax=Sphingomonas sp. TaxID=28214 RepID=UPI003B001FAF
MRTSRKVALALTLAGVAAGGLGPVLAQDRPESILPPGFGQPAPAATDPAPRATAPATAAAPVRPTVQPLPPLDGIEPTPTPTPTGTPTPVQLDPTTRAYYELPPSARHGTAMLGPVSDGGFGPDAFGRADGATVEGLMRRLSAPLPSRWLSIALRRLLLTQLDTPQDLNGADFAAERAWLLLRMGESTGARAVVQGVDDGDYTPKLYQVALNAMLATGDPAGMCPLADGGVAATHERGWTVAQAICAGLRGEPGTAQGLVKDIRRRGVARGIDLLLAQKVVGAGADGRESITVEWAGVDRLTAWRFGLATAMGVAIPAELVTGVGPQVRYWQALSPAIAASARVGAADAAAGQGVLSSAALVDLYSSMIDDDDADAGVRTAAQDLQVAYTDRDATNRVAALKRLWGATGAVPYGRLVLTARAAALLPPRADQPEVDRLIASMLTAGLDRTAMRWRRVVPTDSDAWAMLALADPAGGTIAYGDLAGYAGSGDAARKQRLLFAGLAGLGRLSAADIERAAQALDVRVGAESAWSRALDRAAANGQPGTVVLLAAIGMQTSDWRGVPPPALYRIVGALRAVGLDGEARMIAAEAIARS